MIVYCINPIDFWAGWNKPQDIFRVLPEENPTSPDWDKYLDASQWEDAWAKAKEGANKIGWEGDIREGPFVSMLPKGDGGSYCTFIIAWKQDNNGTTFVASPYPLPWLEDEWTEQVKV